MIYETISVHYFDHTALLEAIQEANAIRVECAYWANKAAEHLMDDDVTSGQAVQTGEFMNWAKNIEYIVSHWIEILAEKAFECKIYIFSFDEDYIGCLCHKITMRILAKEGKVKSAINPYPVPVAKWRPKHAACS